MSMNLMNPQENVPGALYEQAACLNMQVTVNDLHFLKMEENLIFLENARWPQFFLKEDNFDFVIN